MEYYLPNQIKLAEYYKSLGDKAIERLSIEELKWQPNEYSNSIAIIITHLSGNMLSRWTDFLTTDGEKSWRKRDDEFVDSITSKQELFEFRNKGWDCFLGALNSLTVGDLNKTIYIRNEEHSVVDAISRQMAHYPYHIGQVVFIAKMIRKDSWKSLSIPKGESEKYNQDKFVLDKKNKHFIDEA